MRDVKLHTVLPQTAGEYRLLHSFPCGKEEMAWREFLSRVELPSHYNSPEFFLEPYWAQNRPFAVLAFYSGKMVGVLTGIHRANEVECGRPSRPQICFDRTADRAVAEDLLFRGLMREAGSAKLITVYSWIRLPTPELYGFCFRSLEGNVVVDLTQGPQALWEQCHRHRRNQVRFAIRKGLVASQATTQADFEACHEVYRCWRRTRRKTIHGEELPYERLQIVWRLSKNRRVFLVRLADKAIALSCFRFFPGGLIEYSENHSVDEFLNLKPNDLALWRATEWACEQGLRSFSLGGTDKFHKSSGGSVIPIYRYRLDRTLTRRHDLAEAVLDAGRVTLGKMPWRVQEAIRGVLGKK